MFMSIFLIFVSSNITRYTMGYPTKLQLIKRQKSEQWYVNLPSAIAQAMDFQRGEIVEWLIEDKKKMVLMRSDKAVEESKKKLKTEL
jgi:hypothetical protein